jgi:stearoyl-CoA desaturase (delta-9 desaturase)
MTLIQEFEPAISKTTKQKEKIDFVSGIPFFLMHLLPLFVFVTGITLSSVILCVVLYAIRMLGITVGYHRYFSHKTFHLNRFNQFMLALIGVTAAQKGPLWWASHHRMHHKYADTDRDIHSPIKGFWWSHVGWIIAKRFKNTEFENIKDFAKYPELRFLNRFQALFPWLLGVASFFIAGWPGLVVGFGLSTVLLWHATFLINSVAHLWGKRTYNTPDTSRNSFLLSVITFGEGWHNNHHNYPPSAKLGERWWEIDFGYYVLKFGKLVGIVKNIRLKAPKVLIRRRIPAS